MATNKKTDQEEKTGRDRRRAERIPHHSMVELHDGDGFVINGVGQLINFSTGGLCFETRRVFKTGDLIQANLRLPKATALTISGRVVRVQEGKDVNEYGVEFDSIKIPELINEPHETKKAA